METLQNNRLWHVNLVIEDLINQAGISENDLTFDLGFFNYKTLPVIVSHEFGNHLVVSYAGFDDKDFGKLVDGFSKIVEYDPFCKYNLKSGPHMVLTYEWDKVNPEKRYKELEKKESVFDLSYL